MFELIYSSGPHGDETCWYDVKMDKPCTVREFIDEVLKTRPREWGEIRITGKDIEYRDEDVCNYSHGEIKTLKEKYLDRMVFGGRANGGWSAMGYYLRVMEE